MTGLEILTTMGLATTGATGVLYASPLIAALPSMATVSSIMGGVGALSSVMGGMQQQTAANDQSEQVLASATMAGRESARQAASQAGREKESSERTRRAQKLTYLSSGVSLDGSPLMMMEKTRQTGLDNVDEILSSGASASTSALAEGRIKAQSLKSQGRQAFMSGISSGVSSLLR